MPVFRACHLFPHLALLEQVGSPIAKMLARWGLPPPSDFLGAELLPLTNSMRFIHHAARREAIDDFELRAARHIRVTDLSAAFLAAAHVQPNLYSALTQFSALASTEANYTHFWMRDERSGVKLFTRFSGSDADDDIRSSEWSQIMCWISVVRAYAGDDWQPSVLALQSNSPVGDFTRSLFPNARILTGQNAAWIDVPRNLFHLRSSLIDNLESPPTERAREDRPSHEFPRSLMQALKPYLSNGHVHVNKAAEIAGLSSRTLQRRLGENNVSYTELMHIIRFEEASKLLMDPDLKVIDIACELGWDDPSHFTRAFRRMAGVTPKEYRKLRVSA